MACRCIDCYFLGYRREEIQKGGPGYVDTIHRHPESLSADPRQLLLAGEQAALARSLVALRANGNRLMCLRVCSDGTTLNDELALSIPDPDEWLRLCNSAVRHRECGDFRMADPSLPYSVFVELEDERTRAVARQKVMRDARVRQLALLRSALVSLERSSLAPQARGTALEPLLRDLLHVYGLNPVLNVTNSGEQLDVTFWHGQMFVIAEARWRADPVDTPQMRDFFGKLVERPPFTIGLMLSFSNFTGPALEYLSRHSGERTVLPATRGDLDCWLTAEPELPEWLARALRSRLEHPQRVAH